MKAILSVNWKDKNKNGTTVNLKNIKIIQILCWQNKGPISFNSQVYSYTNITEYFILLLFNTY